MISKVVKTRKAFLKAVKNTPNNSEIVFDDSKQGFPSIKRAVRPEWLGKRCMIKVLLI